LDTNTIISELRELTSDFVKGKRNRQETVDELNRRINPTEIYDMPDTIPERLFITEVFVSLNSLAEEGFATSRQEMEYIAECFEGKRTFEIEEIRRFTVGPYENEK
jgi:hypothetical protein